MRGSQPPPAPAPRAPLLTPDHRIAGHLGLLAVPGQVLTSESHDVSQRDEARCPSGARSPWSGQLLSTCL